MDTILPPSAALRRGVRLVALLNLSYFGIEFAVALVIGSVSLFADSIDFLEDTSINLLILLRSVGRRWSSPRFCSFPVWRRSGWPGGSSPRRCRRRLCRSRSRDAARLRSTCPAPSCLPDTGRMEAA